MFSHEMPSSCYNLSKLQRPCSNISQLPTMDLCLCSSPEKFLILSQFLVNSAQELCSSTGQTWDKPCQHRPSTRKALNAPVSSLACVNILLWLIFLHPFHLLCSSPSQCLEFAISCKFMLHIIQIVVQKRPHPHGQGGHIHQLLIFSVQVMVLKL